ncbi:MAG: N-acetylmuramic acid 6-phosphate etherase [Phycisphaerales bacterium]|nr:N-acetylmuramic acid 6-phosphate etherase [Phycisphaerales bacterium]
MTTHHYLSPDTPPGGPSVGLPPDRSSLLTEQRNPRSLELDRLSVAECVALINQEDASVPGAVAAAAGEIAEFIGAAEARLRAGGRLIYLGAGTSGRLGVLDASECPPTFQTDPSTVIGLIAGGDGALRRSSEGREDEPEGAAAELAALNVDSRDAVLGIAAGGTTPYVLGGLRMAHARGAYTGLLVCARVDRAPFVGTLIAVLTGPEVVTGSTRMKAGTATKLVLNTISTTLMVRLGKVYENLMVDLRASNAKLLDRAARIVGELTGLGRPASFDLLGRAGGAVKTAVVMHRLGLDRGAAEERLAGAGGRLRIALEGAQAP